MGPLAGGDRHQTAEDTGGLDKLPSADPVLARTWLLAHLIAAVLTDDLAHEIVGFPPSEG